MYGPFFTILPDSVIVDGYPVDIMQLFVSSNILYLKMMLFVPFVIFLVCGKLSVSLCCVWLCVILFSLIKFFVIGTFLTVQAVHIGHLHTCVFLVYSPLLSPCFVRVLLFWTRCIQQ